MAPAPESAGEPNAARSDYLFVYGTLREGGCAPVRVRGVLVDCCRYLGPARAGGRLYEINGYPGFVASTREGEKVIGDLYQIEVASVLDTLDEYEECSAAFPQPHEYRREIHPVHSGGRDLHAWVYVYNRSIQHLTRVDAGDYFEPE